MFKKLVLLIIIALVAMPAHAQDDGLVDYVRTAFTSVYDQGTYTIEGEHTLTMTALISGETSSMDFINGQTDFRWVLTVNPEGDILSTSGTIDGTMNMEIGQQNTRTEVDQEVRLEENILFMKRSIDVEGDPFSPIGALDGQWIRVDLEELEDSYWEEHGLQDASFDDFLSRIRSQMMPVYVIRVDRETISTIAERDQVIEAGRTLRVFEVSLNNKSLVPEDIGSLLTTTAAFLRLSTLQAAQGQNGIFEVLDSTEVSQIIYVDTETGYVFRVSMELSIDLTEIVTKQFGEGLDSMVITVVVNTRFSDIGKPHNISLPARYDEMPPEAILQ